MAWWHMHIIARLERAEVGEPGIHANTSKVYIRPCFKETERELEDLVYMKSWVQIPALHGT